MREEQAFGTHLISLDFTLMAGLLYPGQQKRTMRRPEAKSGL